MQRALLFPFFAALTEAGRAQFGALRAVRVGAAQRLLAPGDAAGGAYLVLKGALRVYYVTEEGREATLYRVEPGGTCVLALSSTLLDEPYPAWVEAGSAGGTFVRVDADLFRRAMDLQPAFRHFVLSALSSRVFELMRTLEEVATSTVVRRVVSYLLRNATEDGKVTVTQIRLATELGTAREVVFRALRLLAAQKFIRTQRGAVWLLDRSGLARMLRPSFNSGA